MNNEMVKYEEGTEVMTVDIDEATINEIAELADGIAIFAKVTDGGFLVNEKFVPELRGRIIGLNHYLVKWEDKTCHKLPHVKKDQDIPEGYERRCDVRVMAGDQAVAISLSKSSFVWELSPYIKWLRSMQLNPAEAITRCFVKRAKNKYGSFNVVHFEMIDRIDSKSAPPDVADNNEDPWG